MEGGGGAHTQPGGNFNVTLEAVGLHSHTHTIQYISRVHMHVVVCHSSRRQPHLDSAAQLLLCHPCCSPAVIPLSTIHSTPAGHLCALFQLAHHHSSCPLTFCSINILAVCAVCVCRVCCRPQRKKVHWSMHSLACLCAVLGLIAAWKSHTLKVIVQDTLMSHILACLAEQWLTASHFLPLRHLKHGSDGPIGMPGDFTAVMHCVIPLAA